MWLGQTPAIRLEAHYGDRVAPCYSERPSGVHAMFEAAAARWPEREAVADEQRRLTYAELDAEIDAVAAGFQRHGIASGDRIGVMLENSVEFLVVLYAIARIGAIALPINIREQRPEVAYVTDHAGAVAIVYEHGLRERLPRTDEAPALRLRIPVRAPTAEPLSLEGLVAARGVAHRAGGTDEDIAMILYTSGTTGRPKGATLTHLGLVIAAMNYVTVAGLREGDRASVAVPMTHVTGISGGLLPMLLVGGAVLSTRAFKAGDFLARAAADRMTFVVMVPAMYALCLLQPDFDKLDLSAWRVGAYGGAPMAAATIERLAVLLPALALINCYGSTETVGPHAICPPGDTLRKRDCVGRTIPTGEIIIVDDDGRQLPTGETGEIWIRGGSVVPGYWNNPEATAKEFQAGYWKSGDLGSIDDEGFVRVLDRKKDMLNRGGYKIYSSEVEHVMMAYPGVVEAAIIAKPCPVLGERVHAVLMVTEEPFDEKGLTAHCVAALSNYKVPESFTIGREPLPRNANGKLMKRDLRDRLFGGSA